MLPRSITQPSTVIVNTDAHTQSGSHWLAIRLEHRFSTAFSFDYYGLPPHIQDMETFLRRNCTVLDYNTIELQGPLSMVCGEYCCLFTLYTDRGYTGKQFVGLITPDIADQQVKQLFPSEFGSLRRVPRGGQFCTHGLKGELYRLVTLFTTRTPSGMEAVAVIDLETLYGAHGEEAIKEVSVVGEYVQEKFRFLPPYTMEHHGSTSSGINLDDGSFPYSTITQTMRSNGKL